MTKGWPLEGVRVLDLSTQISGAYATKLFVDAGADVIKGEPAGGDPLRKWTASGVELPAGEDGALFRFLNAGKRSVEIDLESDSGRALLLDLVATVDLVVESAGPGVLNALGVGFDGMRTRNPALSLVSISDWGATGPWADRPATEFTLQAATGSTAYRGLRDRVPCAVGGRFGEWVAGTYAAVGAIAAWRSARDTGRGRHVDLSTFESILLSMTIYHDLNGQWVEGPLPRAIEVPSIEPAKDGWVGFCTITSQQWKDFCFLIERPEVGDDDRYLDGRRRMEELPFMQEIIHSWTRERTVDEIVERAALLRIPVAPLGDGRCLPSIDHFAAREVYVESAHGFLQPRVPYRLEKTPLPPLTSAPKLGEHEESVRAELVDARPSVVGSGDGKDDHALPFAGVRVVDLTAFWAGPIATGFLGDLGADVVKVESIQHPDLMRLAGAVPNEKMWEWSPVFHGANPGKRAVTLQLDHPDGRALLRRLVEGADVVIENYSARVLENFDLGWETIREWNPRVVLARMPAFGLDGPWRDRTGFAMTIEQVSGLAQLTGYEDLPLVPRGACDPLGGMHAVFALTLALEHQRRTGEGQLVEVPLVEVALNVAAEQVLEHSAYGRLLERDTNRGPVSAPQGVYACANDELIAVATATDAQWRALVSCLGSPPPDWAMASELAHAAGRRANHDAIDAKLADWFSAKPCDEIEARLLEAGVPAARLVNAHYVLPNPQLEHRGFFRTLEHPVTGATRYPGFPMRFSGLEDRPHRTPPTLGQNNRDVLGGELGLSDEELERLEEAKVIGTRPTFM